MIEAMAAWKRTITNLAVPGLSGTPTKRSLRTVQENSFERMTFDFLLTSASGKAENTRLRSAVTGSLPTPHFQILKKVVESVRSHYVDDELPEQLAHYVASDSAPRVMVCGSIGNSDLIQVAEALRTARQGMHRLRQKDIPSKEKPRIEQAEKTCKQIMLRTAKAALQPPNPEQVHQLIDRIRGVLEADTGLGSGDLDHVTSQLAVALGVSQKTLSALAVAKRRQRHGR